MVALIIVLRFVNIGIGVFARQFHGGRDLLVKTVRERRHKWNSEPDL